MDRKVFYDRVRGKPFRGALSAAQVSGLGALLDAWTGSDDRQLAYLLATAYHETDATMQPIAEYGKGKGRPYGAVDATGKAPYGRGYVQLTWDYNYQKADTKLGLGGRLARNYDLALQPDIAARIIVRGMLEGWFTGRKLADYIGTGKADYLNARRIINGTDKAGLIAGYAASFEDALKAARTGAVSAPAKPAATAAAKPAVAKPAPAPSLLSLLGSFIGSFAAWRNVDK